jgi:hypothetical protein
MKNHPHGSVRFGRLYRSAAVALLGICTLVASALASQPLPQGKANFSVVMGNFDTTGYTWVRIMDWTFNASAGTVAGTSWTWDSTGRQGKYLPVFN